MAASVYADAASLGVEEFASKYTYAEELEASGGSPYEDDVELGMAEHDTAVPEPGSPEWKQLIADLPAAPKLSLGGAYLHEKQDPKHRMGDLLESSFSVYQQKHPEDPAGAHFYTWLDAMPDYERVLLVSNATSGHSAVLMRGGATGNIKPSMVKAFMKGVAYLDKAGRKSRQVHFNAGTAFQDTAEGRNPLSTAEMSTVFSGKGFGIWVISEKGKLYVGNHIKGMVHHSSFLAGASVMCGGEMWARNGKILLLTAKSGHYQPRRENMQWALQALETCVSNFGEIKVMVWKPYQPQVYLVSPATFSSSYDWRPWGNISKDEMTRLRAGNFASFPSA